MAFVDFSFVVIGFFALGLLLYLFVLVREVVLLFHGGTTAMYFGWYGHKLMLGAFFLGVAPGYLVFVNPDGEAAGKLRMFGAGFIGLISSFFVYIWVVLTLMTTLDPRKLQAYFHQQVAGRE